MLPTTIRSPPSEGDYVTLAEYQSTTPESFTDGKPVLHFQLTGARATIPKSQSANLAIFPSDSTSSSSGSEEELLEQTVDVFANSVNFTIFSQKAEAGISIPYPSISIHAIKQITPSAESGATQAVWMQLEFSDGGADDDDFQTVELTVIPASSSETENAASQLYEAIAACSNLHPDPNNEGDEDDEEDNYDRIVFEGSEEHEAIEGFSGVLRGAADGGLPPPMPGSGGWITADNVNEYFDEEGNWIGPNAEGDEEAEELGEGAGRVRDRDELEQEGVNGHGADEDAESKRPRVE